MKVVNRLTDEIMAEGLAGISFTKGDRVVYQLEQGQVLSKTIKDSKDVHVIDSWLDANTVFPTHAHEGSIETIILYKGGEASLWYQVDAGEAIEIKLRVGIPVYMPEGANHQVTTKGEAWIMAVVVPPDSHMRK